MEGGEGETEEEKRKVNWDQKGREKTLTRFILGKLPGHVVEFGAIAELG